MREEPFQLTRREMLKCMLGLPATICLLSGTSEAYAHRGVPLQLETPDADWRLLWQGRVALDNTWRDLRGNASSEIATVQGTGFYSQLLWTGYKQGSDPVSFRVLGRSVDLAGIPLYGGWRLIHSGTLDLPPNRWFRLLIGEGYWDEYRIELQSSTPQLVESRLMGRQEYLPKPLHQSVSKPLLTATDTLLVRAFTVDQDVDRDLLRTTWSEFPTIDHCGPYRLLIWTGVKRGSDAISYLVRARTTNFSGEPLGTGWLTIVEGTITGAADTWYRVVISQPGGLFFDQYRIQVYTTANPQEIRYKIVGVR